MKPEEIEEIETSQIDEVQELENESFCPKDYHDSSEHLFENDQNSKI